MAHVRDREIGTRRREARRRTYQGKLLSVEEMLTPLGDECGPLPRRTWQQWRACGKAPKCYKLPNGRVVCREEEFESWFESLLDYVGAAA